MPYYQRHNYTYLPKATTLQLHPPVYHTSRDTAVLTCLQQPPYNNINLSNILPETQLYLSAYSNHLTITPTCLLILPETQLYFLVNSNHISITSICLPYYQSYNCTFLSIATTYNTHLSTILSEAQLYFPVNSNHLTITPTRLPYYQRYDCTYLPTATTSINLASLPFKRKFFIIFLDSI